MSNREFYFVRHGQTDHNISEQKMKGDHHENVPLNATGRGQAQAIEPLIVNLPIRTICTSPMRRAQETKEIISARLEASHHTIDSLGECSAKVWQQMYLLGMNAPLPESGEVALFMERVKRGIDSALALPGPTLIVAHGGIHWAACCLLGIREHHWSAENCAVVHFSMQEPEKWTAKKLAL